MDDNEFRSELLKKADKLIEYCDRGRGKPRLSKPAAVVVGLVGFIATGFAVYQGYVAYARYALEKEFATYYKSVAKEFVEKAEYQRALEAYKEAERLRPYDPEVYYGRVKAFAFFKALRKEDLDLAEVQCKLLIKHDPTSAEASKFLGIIYANKGNFLEAEKAFKKAIELKGGQYNEAQYDLGRLYAEWAKTFSRLSTHGLNQRVTYLNRAIDTNKKLEKKDAGSLYNIACDYGLLGQIDDAIQTLQIALEQGYDRYHLIAADADLDAIRQDHRLVQLLRNRYTEVIVKYQGMIETGQATPSTFHVLAWIQLFSTDPSKVGEGIEYVNHALSVEPNNATYLATLARLYAARGNVKLAREKIKQAIEKDPSRPYYADLLKSW